MESSLEHAARPAAFLSPMVGQHENRQTIADRMEALAIELRSISDDEIETVPTDSTLVALASKIYSARRDVDKIFGMHGFSVSPAWDIILDLYKANALGQDISVSSACIGAACPATTGLRWIQALENMKLIERRPDPEDRRRFVVSLTEVGKIKAVKALSSHL
ncbi:winged helix DNA-binding protein [Porphyrobacter sp. AAP60]|uniref:winged helix DNA-binding protein n=1 Tax=Porphyrobacter sp. AAP60 TaxID=1523423 RepID=UPI0012E2B0A5|nr:winged helix DNA-binding protein [Porphyrobacter sp. AAP60]